MEDDGFESAQKNAQLELKIAEMERQLNLLKTFKLHKLRDGASNDIQVFCDPLLHAEINALYQKYNET
jgi:hypothetical protein